MGNQLIARFKGLQRWQRISCFAGLAFILYTVVGFLVLLFWVIWLILRKFKMNFYLAKFFAICVVTLWNFLANFFITFNQG